MQLLDVTSLNCKSIYELLNTDTPTVMCLCASWCHVCNDFRQVFEASARESKHCAFLWIDIENETALVDDLDIDDFPMLMIEDGKGVRFYGTIEPRQSTLMMLVNANTLEANRQTSWKKENYPKGIRQRLETILTPAVE